jgi:tetratricopeptide (TPR) repeat protein
VVVTSRHWDDEQQVYSKNRWWLKKADAQADWQFYDLVDMDMNVRTSMMVALATAAAMDRKPWLQSMMEIVALVQQFGSDLESVVEVEGMQKRLEMLTQEDVPVEIRTFALTLLTIKYIGTENRLDDALETIEEIGRLDPKSALRFFMQGNVYVAMEEPQKAISSFEKYAAAYGWEADVCESVSDVYMQLGNAEKSIEYATRGLADNKDSWGCLISLLVALPDEQKSQIDEHLKAMDHNIDVIEIAIDYAIEIDDLTSARHMYRLLQKHHPDSELVDYYQEQFDQ